MDYSANKLADEEKLCLKQHQTHSQTFCGSGLKMADCDQQKNQQEIIENDPNNSTQNSDDTMIYVPELGQNFVYKTNVILPNHIKGSNHPSFDIPLDIDNEFATAPTECVANEEGSLQWERFLAQKENIGLFDHPSDTGTPLDNANQLALSSDRPIALDMADKFVPSTAVEGPFGCCAGDEESVQWELFMAQRDEFGFDRAFTGTYGFEPALDDMVHLMKGADIGTKTRGYSP